MANRARYRVHPNAAFVADSTLPLAAGTSARFVDLIRPGLS